MHKNKLVLRGFIIANTMNLLTYVLCNRFLIQLGCPCLSSAVNKAAKIGCRQASGCFSCPQALGLLKLLICWEQMGSLSRPNNKQRSFLPCLNSCATVCACSSRLSRQCTLLRSTNILSSHKLVIF